MLHGGKHQSHQGVSQLYIQYNRDGNLKVSFDEPSLSPLSGLFVIFFIYKRVKADCLDKSHLRTSVRFRHFWRLLLLLFQKGKRCTLQRLKIIYSLFIY